MVTFKDRASCKELIRENEKTSPGKKKTMKQTKKEAKLSPEAAIFRKYKFLDWL